MKPMFLTSLLLLACGSGSAFAEVGRLSDNQSAATLEVSRMAELNRKIATTAMFSRHFIASHSIALVLRPVGSVRNLLALTFHATTGLAKDIALDTVFFPRLADHRVPLVNGEGMDLDKWEKDLDAMTRTRRARGSLNFLVDGEAFFNRLTAEIAEAEDSIKIRTYIFDNDDYALQIADLLKARSADIPVDILVDGLGTLGGSLIASTSIPEDFVAPVSIKSYLEKDSAVNLRMLNNTWLMGDHTKTYIFDDKVAFLGGMNIGREYRYDWHDLMVEISGPVVDQLSFDDAKASAHSALGELAYFKSIKRRNSPVSANSAELRLIYTKPHDAQIYRAQVEAIRRSRSYIYIENAYLADDLVLYELVKARQRGVDVRVVVPSRPDSGLMDRSNVLAINTLMRYGARVYRYPGMTHVKAAIYDGWACFGTANFDKLSFKINKEVNIATSDPDIVAALKQQIFEVDFAISEEVLTPQQSYLKDHIYEKIVDVIL